MWRNWQIPGVRAVFPPAGRFSLAQPVCAALLACSGPPRLGEGVAAPSVPALLGLQRTGAAGLEKAGGGDGLRMG